ncbi:hypothetical protein [Mucilaginibacter terrae]|uniref:Carboxypeptidase-like regulatory domain-containing protein n=1 Tax=Mucilaginibacter terrae TaxID=1955052 RepID=A0ABU3H0H8_9SPHI|nr:hypothetical protein [Mucilaginibacter terrae]MDT3405524.1 hypothetical protein [Mucilaginibacter terrae]
MKTGLFILLLFVSTSGFAQRITGVVIDRLTRLPVYNAKIETPKAIAYANMEGVFSLSPVKNGDSCTVSYQGYKLSRMAISFKSIKDTLRIYLDKPSILLSNVNVSGKRDFKTDSVRNRQMFANIYNYRGGGLKEAMIEKASLEYKPNNYIDGPNNTLNLAGINVLQVLNLFSKDKSSKLQKTLIADEGESYVDRYFTRRKIAALTSMKGDSLQNFMVRYRPTVYQVKTMTDYELALYIKASYAEYKKQTK